MYGGRLPIPAVKVEDMSTTNREDGKTTIVVLASEPSYSAFGNMVRKWLVCAICALAAVAMNAMWITANAYGDNSGDSSDSSSSSTTRRFLNSAKVEKRKTPSTPTAATRMRIPIKEGFTWVSVPLFRSVCDEKIPDRIRIVFCRKLLGPDSPVLAGGYLSSRKRDIFA